MCTFESRIEKGVWISRGGWKFSENAIIEELV